MSTPKLVLIDGHSLAFRAFHAIPLGLTAPDGELTNAVFGFTSMLLNVLRDQQPEYVAVAFDVGKTFRHEMFPEYKGHRERMPDELRTQIERIKQVVETLNIPIFTAEGFEADDVLATLARQAEGEGVDSLIVTGDRDILQVVNEHIRVLTSGRQFSDTIIYDPPAVEEKYSLRTDQLVDYKALVGDKSDNIPGVRGIGEKGAVALLQKYGTLEAVYAHLAEVTPERTKKALTEGEADAWQSQTLGRIILDVPIQLDLAACHTRDYDRAKSVELFRDLGFRSLVEKLPAVEADVREGERGSGGAGEEQLALFPSDEAPPERARLSHSPTLPSHRAPISSSSRRPRSWRWPSSWLPRRRSRSTPRPPASTRSRPPSSGCRWHGAARTTSRPTSRWDTSTRPACRGKPCERRSSRRSPTAKSPRSRTTPATT